ncbi:hypothetical protein BH09ACT12_BH09ACT12_05050 [soil metagenome]
MIRATSPVLRHAVQVVKCVVVAVLSFLAVAAPASGAEGVWAAHELSPVITEQAGLDELLRLHECSTTGFGAGVIPGSSLVLQDNRIRHVSFEAGWDVYTGNKPGTLLAVCRVSI